MKNLKYAFLIGLLPLFAYFQLTVLNVLGHSLISHSLVNANQLGLLALIYILADTAILLPAGFLLDKFSTRKIFYITACIAILSTFLFAIAPDFAVMVIAQVCGGIGNAFLFLIAFRLVGLIYRDKAQGIAMAIVLSETMLGGVLSQAPLQHLINLAGWRVAMLFIATAGLLILFLAFEKAIPKHLNLKKAVDRSLAITNLIKAITPNNFINAWYISTLSMPLMVFGALWGVSFLASAGINATHAAWLTGMIFWGMFVGCLLSGFLYEYFPDKKRLLQMGNFCCLAITLSLYFITHHTIALCGAFFFIGIFASFQTVAYTLINELNPFNQSSAMGLCNVIVMGATALLQYTFTVIVHITQDYSDAFLFITAVFLLNTLFVFGFTPMTLARAKRRRNL